MMSNLTLVQLAQAIEQGKTIEDNTCGGWTHAEIINVSQLIGLWFVNPDSVRIKPKLREYWLIPYTMKLGMQVSEAHPRDWPPAMNVVGLDYKNPIHVKEVL